MASTNNNGGIATPPGEQNNLLFDIFSNGIDFSSNVTDISISSNASTLELEPKTPPPPTQQQNLASSMDECELFGNFIATQVALIAQMNPDVAANLQKNIMEDCKKRLAKYGTQHHPQDEKEKPKLGTIQQQCNNNMQSTNFTLPSDNRPTPNNSPINSQWFGGQRPSTSTQQQWNGPMNAWPPKNLLD